MFTVYRVVNKINGKYYIGVHKTEKPNDAYFGSGRAIRAAIKKYGRDNFEKIVLAIFDNAAAAYAREIELTHDFQTSNTYNLRRGGVGGFTKEVALRGAIASIRVGAGRKGGLSSSQKKVGVHALTQKELAVAGRKGGLANRGTKKPYAYAPNTKGRSRTWSVGSRKGIKMPRYWSRRKKASVAQFGSAGGS